MQSQKGDILGKVVGTLLVALLGLIFVATLPNVPALRQAGVETSSLYLMMLVLLIFMGLLTAFSLILVALMRSSGIDH
jgi:uncharacterized membrane protein